MEKHANPPDASELPQTRVAPTLKALRVVPDQSAEHKLVALARLIERQLKKCQDLSERVLARLDEVEAEYPPLPRQVSGIEKTHIGSVNLVRSPCESNSWALGLRQRFDSGPTADWAGPGNASSQKPALTSKSNSRGGEVSDLVGNIVAALHKAHRPEMRTWVKACAAIDAREGLPDLLKREQSEWDKLDDLIRRSEEIPAVSLKSLQAKARIINACNNAHSELSFGDMIDEALTDSLLRQLRGPARAHDD